MYVEYTCMSAMSHNGTVMLATTGTAIPLREFGAFIINQVSTCLKKSHVSPLHHLEQYL